MGYDGSADTGIDVEVTGLIGVYTDPEHVIAFTDGEVRQEFSICFRAHPIGGTPRTSSESSEVHWVARDDLVALDIHPVDPAPHRARLHRPRPAVLLLKARRL